MDATASVREYLKTENIHDYATQGQGQSHKHRVKSQILGTAATLETYASLYRPETKQGDPRIWFDGLKKYFLGGQVACIIAHANELYVLNASDPTLWASAEIAGSPLWNLVRTVRQDKNSVAFELLDLIRQKASGPLRTVVAGDTGVGMTLERALGLMPNSSRAPDYKGIELKAARHNKKQLTRSSLFAQVPDWSISQIKNFKDLAYRYGYFRNGMQRLNCTVSTQTINSQGLYLTLDESLGFLRERNRTIQTTSYAVHERGPEADYSQSYVPHIPPLPQVYEKNARAVKAYEEVVAWRLELLKDRLRTKHPETFWVTATSSGSGRDEIFTFNHITHTKGPLVGAFATLLDAGVVTVDHLIKCPPDGATKERGPLFKIKKSDFNLLFPRPDEYQVREAT